MSTHGATQQRDALRRELDELSREAQRYIKSKRRRSALIRAVELSMPGLLLVPAAWLVLRIMLGLAAVSGWWVLFATLSIPLALLLFAVASVIFEDIEQRDALAAIDAELGLADRLATADEFLQRAETSPFIEAALEDGARVAPGARNAVLHLAHERLPFGWCEGRVVLGSLLLILLSTLGGGGEATGTSTGHGGLTQSEELAVIDVLEEDEVKRPQPEPRVEREEPEVPPATPAKTEAGESRRDKASKLSDQTKESGGKTGEGRSSDAESTSGASESRGMPSNQAQQSKAGEKPQKKDAKKKAKPPAELTPTEKKNAEENSGATAGKGSSKGSNKNPAVSKWSSKDQVTTQDDQEIEDDEETEDEEEDQESRGGMQPNLRDRKPPVSRDLRIGFGNQKDPDANGRGGPSEAKKSRGTASLVLGVPIPDRVKGQPNPGKTKITQERIEPKAEDASAIEASARSPRAGPAGHLQERELTPWMRTLVREYFLTLRSKNRQS